MTEPIGPPAHFGTDASAVIIEQMTIRDRDVTREAQRWTSGERGPIVDDSRELGRADLTNYVTEALRIGAHALSVTGQAQESRALERMLKDVGDKTADSTAKAAELTQRTVVEASEAVTKAASDAKKAITDADTQSRKEFTTAVATAKNDLNSELRRLSRAKAPSSSNASSRCWTSSAPISTRRSMREPPSCWRRWPSSSTRPTPPRPWPSTPPNSPPGRNSSPTSWTGNTPSSPARSRRCRPR